jgi:nucleoside-diphosphate-sugar epimerase
MKSVLITGITCYIGCELARRLVADGVRVSGIVRKGSQLDRLSPFRDQVCFYVSDGSQRSLDVAVSESQPDIIIHLAGFYVWEHTPEQEAELVEANIAFGTRLLEAAKKFGTHKIINTGSHFQYFESDEPRPFNFYAQTKQDFADSLSKYAKEQGFQYVNLIIFESYGPRDWRKKLIQAIAQNQRNGGTMSIVASDPVMDFVYIDDIIDAYIHTGFLLESSPTDVSGQSYALTSGERQPISELIKIFEEVGGKRIVTEKKEDLLGVKRVLNPWNGPVLPGWQPRISLREGIQRFLEDV